MFFHECDIRPGLAPFEAVRPVLHAFAADLPASLQSEDATSWNDWSRQQDKAIRARLDQGDLDTAVNLLLFGILSQSSPGSGSKI